MVFCGKKSKVLPIKQHLKWCESLQTSFHSVNWKNWKKIYELERNTLTGRKFTKTIIFQPFKQN